LTRQDRQHIAAALADGVGYAEIGRRLGRPTSTVSREVARNGGPGGYRADQAQLATGRRVRRRRPSGVTPVPASPGPGAAGGRDPGAVRGFVERFADLMAQTGLSRMASRVFVTLFTSDAGSLTAAELVGLLRVSPASISKAVGYLEQLELVTRERDARGRRERYAVGGGDVWLRAWAASARKSASWAEAAREGVTVLGADTPAGERLGDMGRFFSQLAADMSGGGSALAEVEDALTVLAALVQAAAPLTVEGLAAALGWPVARATAALRLAGPDRLTAAQREALAARD
jgi:DNA-binding transcriptional ArsR family regulator